MQRQPFLARLVSSFLLVLAAACASDRSTRVDDGLLSEVPPESMGVVKERRSAHEDASLARIKARRDAEQAEKLERIARSELETARSRLEGTELSITVAQEGSSAELSSAQRDHERALLVAEDARLQLALRKRERELAERTVKLADEEQGLAEAELEYAKAVAVKQLDLVEAERIVLKDFDQRVDRRRKSVAKAQKRAVAAAKQVAEAREERATVQRQIESFGD
jgi:hypothetical protein